MGQRYLSRREFVAAGGAAFAAATGLTIEQAMAQKGFRLRGKPAYVGGGGEALRATVPGDLALQGYIKYSETSDSFGNPSSDLTFSLGATTIRKMPNGDTHVLIVGKSLATTHAANEPLLEFDITGLTPSLTLASAPVAPLIRNWGPFAENNFQTGSADQTPNAKIMGGLCVDPDDYTKVWWLYGDSYFSSGRTYYPTLGCTVLNDAAGTYQSYGPWNFQNVGGQRARGAMFPIPAAWATANGLGSKRIGFSAGNSSGMAGAHYGCNAYAFESFDPATKPINSNTDANGSTPVTPLLYHLAASPQARNTLTRDCWMAKDAVSGAWSCAAGYTVSNGTGAWGGLDQSATTDTITGAALVATATHEALVFVGHLSMTPPWTPERANALDADGYPHNGYFGFDTSGQQSSGKCCHGTFDPFNSGPGPHTSYRTPLMWFYDSWQLAEVIAGTRAPTACVPATDAQPVGLMTNATLLKKDSPPAGSAMYHDATAGRLYQFLSGKYEFAVNGGHHYPVIAVWGVA